MAGYSVGHQVKSPSGQEEHGNREFLTLGSASLLLVGLLFIEFGPRLGLGFRRVTNLDLGVVLRRATPRQQERREKRQAQNSPTVSETGLSQFESPDEVRKRLTPDERNGVDLLRKSVSGHATQYGVSRLRKSADNDEPHEAGGLGSNEVGWLNVYARDKTRQLSDGCGSLSSA
jgi:hypothetical protein